jgi:lysophospholipase L1-like esterase
VVKKVDQQEPYGPGGFCFTPEEKNIVTYSAKPNYKHLNLFRDVRLFYNSPENTIFKYVLNNGSENVLNVAASEHLQQGSLKNINATTISFNFPASDTLKLYGVSFEDSTGIYVDNFGLRGNSGLGLYQISEKMHRQINQLQDYELIILQYGLNVVAPDSKDLNWYINPMINIVERLKRSYPDASILLMGVSDRSIKIDGDYRTMESIPVMISAQREIARRTQIAFFNLFEAMGGENSMVAYVESDPPLANKDYTHLTFQGGRKVAGIFVKSLLNEFQKYNDQVKNRVPADSLNFIGSVQ